MGYYSVYLVKLVTFIWCPGKKLQTQVPFAKSVGRKFMYLLKRGSRGRFPFCEKVSRGEEHECFLPAALVPNLCSWAVKCGARGKGAFIVILQRTGSFSNLMSLQKFILDVYDLALEVSSFLFDA